MGRTAYKRIKNRKKEVKEQNDSPTVTELKDFGGIDIAGCKG
jgi:hypothetical protein